MANMIEIRNTLRHIENGIIDDLSDEEILTAIDIVGVCDIQEFLASVAEHGSCRIGPATFELRNGGWKHVDEYKQYIENQFNVHLQEYVDHMHEVRTTGELYPPF